MDFFRKSSVIKRKRRERAWGPLGYALLFIFIFSLMAYLFIPIFTKKNELLEGRLALEEQINKIRQDNTRMDDEITNLESDSYVIEKIAREELGLTKPGEI